MPRFSWIEEEPVLPFVTLDLEKSVIHIAQILFSQGYDKRPGNTEADVWIAAIRITYKCAEACQR